MKDPSLRPRSRAADAANAARSLYRGLTPQLVGVVPIALVYMPSYEVASGALKGTPLQSTPIAGVLTGVASAVVRVPVSVIKSRIQLGLPSGGRGASPSPNPLPRPSNL